MPAEASKDGLPEYDIPFENLTQLHVIDHGVHGPIHHCVAGLTGIVFRGESVLATELGECVKDHVVQDCCVQGAREIFEL